MGVIFTAIKYLPTLLQIIRVFMDLEKRFDQESLDAASRKVLDDFNKLGNDQIEDGVAAYDAWINGLRDKPKAK